MDEIEWWEFETSAELAEQVAGDIGFVIESAVEAHGSARVAIPGSDVPEEFYKALLANRSIDWSKVTLIPTDDRLVPLDDERSNYRKLEGYFANKGAHIISLVDESALEDRREAARLANQRLSMLAWPLDLVCLGMGSDGHVAAILPGPDLEGAVAGPKERQAVGVRPDQASDDAVDRVTLTGASLSSARAMMIVISGVEKRQALEQATKEGPLSTKPVGRILADIDTGIDIFWSA